MRQSLQLCITEVRDLEQRASYLSYQKSENWVKQGLTGIIIMEESIGQLLAIWQILRAIHNL